MSLDLPDAVIGLIRMRARSGLNTGRDRSPVERAYQARCCHFHWQTGTLLIFTHDTGHHSSGWMKNPDFERCRHLSLSFRSPFPERDPASLASAMALARLMTSSGFIMPNRPFDYDLARRWVKLILGDDARHSWEEGPFTREGKTLEVRHWRVFVDRNGEAIRPRGEVYAKALTELGWKSWSEVQDTAPLFSAC